MRFRDSFLVVRSEEPFTLGPDVTFNSRNLSATRDTNSHIPKTIARDTTTSTVFFFNLDQNLLTMNAATSNLAISLLVMQSKKPDIFHTLDSLDNVFPTVARKISFDDPEVLLYARIGYVSAQAIVLALYFVCSSKVSICRPQPAS